MKALLDIIRRHKRGEAVGVYSLCSAHPTVIAAAAAQARTSGVPLLVEATCNQVNQFGGYTGLQPADFRRTVLAIAADAGLPAAQLWLGGDHLGPNVWRKEPAANAMDKACGLVAAYVEAGFRKIHLDCSMACGDDPHPLPEALIAARAARLCAVAEAAWSGQGEAPVYVIGTEVPIPGGAAEDLDTLAVTSPAAVDATIETHRKAFIAAGLGAAWPRVIALVVQPGVEFDHHKVIDYRPEQALALSRHIAANDQFVFEAHSTDYQTPAHLRALVDDHFAILKIGPAATYALRETLWRLAALAEECFGRDAVTDLRATVLAAMQADPAHWRDHYPDDRNDPNARLLDMQYSLSDRIRYYWSVPSVQAACAALLKRLRETRLPLTLLSQFLPLQYAAVREGQLEPGVDALLADGVAAALRPYLQACDADVRLRSA